MSEEEIPVQVRMVKRVVGEDVWWEPMAYSDDGRKWLLTGVPAYESFVDKIEPPKE